MAAVYNSQPKSPTRDAVQYLQVPTPPGGDMIDGIKALTFDTGGTILDWMAASRRSWPRSEPDTVSRLTGLR